MGSFRSGASRWRTIGVFYWMTITRKEQ